MTKSKVIKIVCIILAAVILVSGIITTVILLLNENEASKNNNTIFSKDPIEKKGTYDVYGDNHTKLDFGYDLRDPVHEYDIKESNIDFVKNGKTEFVVVYPASLAAESNISTIVTEIKNLYAEATGGRIEVLSDDECTATDNIISIGNTKQAKESGFTEKVTDDLGRSGFIIETAGSAVYCLAKTTEGVMYAGYEFLTRQMGFIAVTDTVYALDTEVADMKLREMHIKDIPDFQVRVPGYANALGRDRLRTASYTDGFNDADNNAFCHNFLRLIPEGTYAADHPNWYGNGQLCLEAHGDAAERELLIQAVVDEMIVRLEAQPEKDYMAFMQMDGGTWCDCAACKAGYALYDKGARAAKMASLIRFTNEVAERIAVWNKDNCPERDVKIFIIRYGGVLSAPVKTDENGTPIKDENGKYIAYSEEFVIADNVAVMYTDATPGKVAMSDSTSFDTTDLDRIVDVSEEPLLYFWEYSACFQNFLIPCYAENSRQENYQYLRSKNGLVLFDQAIFAMGAATDWSELTGYISARLMWDTQLDVEILKEQFFEIYFGEAADEMRTLYDEYTTYIEYLTTQKNYTSNSVSQAFSEEYFPYQTVQHFLTLFDEAYSSIENLEGENPELYQKIYDRITVEAIAWRYLDVMIHTKYYSVELLEQMRQELLKDCQRLGFAYFRENGSIDGMFS